MIRRLALLAVLLVPAAARADGGTVLRLDGADIYVDLGSDAGVAPGSELILRHVVVATHPVTRKRVRDTFPLGRLTVVRTGRKLCVARAPAALAPRVAVGDEIDLASAPRAFVDPWAASGPAGPSPAPLPPAGDQAGARRARIAALEAAEVAWRQTLGKPPAERIAIWQAYLKAHPASQVAGTVRTEIADLTAQQRADELRQTPAARAGAADREQARIRDRLRVLVPGTTIGGPLAALPPERGYQGQPVDLVFLVVDAGAVSAAWLHYRRAGEPSYRRAPLAVEPGGWLRQRIPGDAVQPPGLDWFVEVQRSGDDPPEEAIGTAADPMLMRIDESVDEPPPDRSGRSRVTLSLDYVDFDGGFQDGFDQYVQAEADFMYRFRRPVHAVRIGFGTLGGDGGPKNVIDEDDTGRCRDANGDVPCRHVNFTYAYAEVEHRVTPLIAVMLRPIAGGAYRNRVDGGGREYFNSVGLKTRLRIGQDDHTNLVLGLGLNEKFGTLVEASFNFLAVPNAPIMLSVQVTDQPVLEDLGVRLIADVGLRRWSWVYPSVRLAYQARDIDHSGVSGGMGLNFDW